MTVRLGGMSLTRQTNKLSNASDATEKETSWERCIETGEGNDLVEAVEELHSGQSQGEGHSKNRYPR